MLKNTCLWFPHNHIQYNECVSLQRSVVSVYCLHIHSKNRDKNVPSHTVDVVNVIAHHIHNPPKNKVAGCVDLTAQRIKAPLQQSLLETCAAGAEDLPQRGEADKSSSIFMLNENKMSTHTTKKPSCLHVHSSWEINQKNYPILVLSRTGAHVYAIHTSGVASARSLFESLNCLFSWHVFKTSLWKLVVDLWGWQVRKCDNCDSQVC